MPRKEKHKTPSRFLLLVILLFGIQLKLGRFTNSDDGSKAHSSRKKNPAPSTASSSSRVSDTVLPVQCDTILQDHQNQIKKSGVQNNKSSSVNIAQMHSSKDVPYLISFSWWDRRLRLPAFKQNTPLPSNPSVRKIQNLLLNTTDDAAFIDVGANVGFMTNYAMALGRTVYAFDPISYNVVKLCEGLQANVEKGYAMKTNANNNYHLFHAAAGSKFVPKIGIVRPSDAVGRFDQSSLSRAAVKQKDVVEEIIPLIPVESIVPDNVPIGVVKIDVQGHEYGVLMGMRNLLSRSTGFPKYVFYEDDPKMTVMAGLEPGACAQLLRFFGYTCQGSGADTLCSKF